jgi:hypothetical protein
MSIGRDLLQQAHEEGSLGLQLLSHLRVQPISFHDKICTDQHFLHAPTGSLELRACILWVQTLQGLVDVVRDHDGRSSKPVWMSIAASFACRIATSFDVSVILRRQSWICAKPTHPWFPSFQILCAYMVVWSAQGSRQRPSSSHSAHNVQRVRRAWLFNFYNFLVLTSIASICVWRATWAVVFHLCLVNNMISSIPSASSEHRQ